MIWIDPAGVRLGGASLGGVSSISVDRHAERLLAERSDFGPHVVFADAPEQRVSVRIVRTVGPEGPGGHRPGDLASLEFRAGPSASDAGMRVVTIQVVVEAVLNRVDPKAGATQTIECVAISSDGVADPVVETPPNA